MWSREITCFVVRVPVPTRFHLARVNFVDGSESWIQFTVFRLSTSLTNRIEGQTLLFLWFQD